MKRLVFLLVFAACRPSSTALTEPAAPAISAAVVSAGSYPKPSIEELKKKLTPLEFDVTQNAETEPPFRNAYWNNHEPGMYVDVATGEPLFSSTDKFESGTGWPSFTRPIEDGRVVSKTDTTLGMARTEVRSKSGDSHLGHVFDDGPQPSGMRYCINSASLRFIPVGRLEAEGYGAYRVRFEGGVSRAPAASTNNACAAPPPGARAGCATTLETAIVSADARGADSIAHVPGVLQVDRGTVRGASAARVLYDPKLLTRERLLAATPKAVVLASDESTFVPTP